MLTNTVDVSVRRELRGDLEVLILKDQPIENALRCAMVSRLFPRDKAVVAVPVVVLLKRTWPSARRVTANPKGADV